MAQAAYITGVAGFLGSHVARQLLQEGYDVAGCDNLLLGKRENVPEGVDLTTRAVQNVAYVGADVVVHCAAIARSAWPEEYELMDHNVEATRHMLTWGVPVIHASSSVVHYPRSSTYARTKTAAEKLVRTAGGTSLRFGNIYGPGQSEAGFEPNVIAAMRRDARRFGTVHVHGDGTQRRRFVHVEDAARAVSAAIRHPLPGEAVDICGEEISIGEIAEMFGVPITYLASRGDPKVIRQWPNEGRRVGWMPTIDLREGLRATILAETG